MKKLLIWGLVIVVGKAGFDSFIRSREDKSVDRALEEVAKELNMKMPHDMGDSIRVEKVEYSNRVVHYSGRVLGTKGLTDEVKNGFQQQAEIIYCRNDYFRKVSVSVEYSFQAQIMRNINDRLSYDTWVTKIDPGVCK